MMSAFLLRFQEPCVSGHQAAVANGGKTGTKILGEKADPKGADYRAILAVQTITKIKGEKDGDRTISGLHMNAVPKLPYISGTQTKTYIRAEADDKDPRQTSREAIPRCC